MVTYRLNSMGIPSDEKVIMTVPAIPNYETDVRMAFDMIQEADLPVLPAKLWSASTSVMEQTTAIFLILAVRTLTWLMWLQVTDKATVFERLVTFTYIHTQRPMCFKGGKHWSVMRIVFMLSVQPASKMLLVFYLNIICQENRGKKH